MAYKPRCEAPGLHHVVCRGNNKRDIFVTDQDRESFLDTLDRKAKKYGWTIYAYCLMPNHYHLVMEIGDGGLADGMCELNTAYATRFNAVHGRINHLFGKRYWSAYLDSHTHLLNAIRYVAQNPRRAGLRGPLESHTWTSYAATIGLALPFARLAIGKVLGLFGPTPEAAKASFSRFCEAPVPSSDVRRQPP